MRVLEDKFVLDTEFDGSLGELARGTVIEREGIWELRVEVVIVHVVYEAREVGGVDVLCVIACLGGCHDAEESSHEGGGDWGELHRGETELRWGMGTMMSVLRVFDSWVLIEAATRLLGNVRCWFRLACLQTRARLAVIVSSPCVVLV